MKDLQFDTFPELTETQRRLIVSARKEKKPILVVGHQGPTGKTRLTKWLRENGVQAYEPFEMECLEIGKSILEIS
ncbi:hypothetical protein [Levilactobacillus fujinensis]|uniref:Uncharacterized protein n=1 Tax=Levilactobacillus fujinensis TaxID=2486024 RepID=A0ABW1TKX1_9LACO|nr:hypothetical protein [Levilactobacillus fujinensis]